MYSSELTRMGANASAMQLEAKQQLSKLLETVLNLTGSQRGDVRRDAVCFKPVRIPSAAFCIQIKRPKTKEHVGPSLPSVTPSDVKI